MDPTGIASGHGGNKEKTTRGRRSWTKFEKDALIECLIEIVHDGWKADNGFRTGFQREFEKEYSNLSDLLSKSGIGWNSTTSMVEVEDESVWDASRKVDPHVKGIRYKTWPYYGQWLEIFGKDRAMGENVVDPTDLFNEMLHTCGPEQEGENVDKFMPAPSVNLFEPEDHSVCKTSKSMFKSGSKGKKQKLVDPDMSMLVESLGMFMKNSDTTFGDIAKKIGTSKGKVIDNNKLNEIMGRIVDLKVADKLKVCDELVQNTNLLDFFMSLPEVEQDEYVWMLLDGKL
ncbi:hypothetical protein ACS0TY_027681 [Phlomoides rotata]